MAVSNELNTLKANISNAYNAIQAKGGTIPTNKNTQNLSDAINTIQGGGGASVPLFSGSYDRVGLKQIGWTDEEVDYYNQYGVRWNSSENSVFILTGEDLLGNDSKTARFIPKSTTRKKFFDFTQLLGIPLIDTSDVTAGASLFRNCYKLTAIPQINTSNMTSADTMFHRCTSLLTIPLLDTSKVTTMASMFAGCAALQTIPKLNTSVCTDTSGMFNGCTALRIIPQIDTSNVTNMSGMFTSCKSLETIPQLDTSKVFSYSTVFNGCSNLTKLPSLNLGSAINVTDLFKECSKLTDVGGLMDFGKTVTASTAANNSYYTLTLTQCKELTHDSLLNIINGLYDISGKATQKILLGTDNKAKLTAEEIAIATNKGWTVS